MCAYQHDFRIGRSTTINLLEAFNVWNEVCMHGISKDIIFLDYAKASDTVPHQHLLNKISRLSIKDRALDWIAEFLTGRKQNVRVSDSTSSWKPSIFRYSSGFSTGPYTFMLFVNDVPDEVNDIISMYTDDTKIFSTSDTDTNLSTLREDLSKLQQWSDKMQMRFHPEKCKLMHLGSSNPKTAYSMRKTNGKLQTLEEAIVEKDLSIHLDNQLKFSKNCQQAASQALRILGCLCHTFKYST